jgi:hypothetical protein
MGIRQAPALTSRPVRLRKDRDFVLISTATAAHVTGVPLDRLRQQWGVQELTRVFADGRVEESLKLPIHWLPKGDIPPAQRTN